MHNFWSIFWRQKLQSCVLGLKFKNLVPKMRQKMLMKLTAGKKAAHKLLMILTPKSQIELLN
jgi:hypothetical protein